MTVYKTGNKLGSSAVEDLFDNSQNLDDYVNDRGNETWNDRFGVERKTIFGIEQIHERQLTSQENRFIQFLSDSGYSFLGDYENGPLTFSERNQYVRYGGQYYRLNVTSDTPYSTAGNTATAFTVDVQHFVLMDGDTLRQELAAVSSMKLIGGLGYTTPEKYSAKGDSITNDTAAVNLALLEAKGTGKTLLLQSLYNITSGFVLDSQITIKGNGKKTGFITSDKITSQSILFHITADSVMLDNFYIGTSASGYGSVSSVGRYIIRIADNIERTCITNLDIDGRAYGEIGFCVGISLSWSNHGLYQNNNIQNCSIGVHGGGSYNKFFGNITDNHFIDKSDNFTNCWDCNSMYWDGFMFEGLKYSQIIGNTVTNNGQSGIYFGGGGNSVSCDNIISGNYVAWNFNHGIDMGVSGTLSDCNDVYGNTVTGNQCYNNRYDGIWLGTVHDCVITGNRVLIDSNHKIKFNSTNDNQGIALRQTTKDCIITGNSIIVTDNQYSSLYVLGTGNSVSNNRIKGKNIAIGNLLTNNSFKGLTGTFTPTIITGDGAEIISTTRGTYSVSNNRITYDLDLNIAANSATGELVIGGFPFLSSCTIYQYLAQCQFTSGMKTGFYQGGIGINVYINNTGMTIASLIAGIAGDIGDYLGSTSRFRIKVEVVMNSSEFTGTFN